MPQFQSIPIALADAYVRAGMSTVARAIELSDSEGAFSEVEVPFAKALLILKVVVTSRSFLLSVLCRA